MADGVTYTIKTDQGTFNIVADEGTTKEQALALAAGSNPQFAQIYPQLQAQGKTRSLASRIQPVASPGLYGPAPGEVPSGKGKAVPGTLAQRIPGAEETQLAEGAPAGAAGMLAAGALTNPAVRTGVGMVGGSKLAQRFGIPSWIGAMFGGSVAGGSFPGRINSRLRQPETTEEIAPSAGPTTPATPSLSQRASQRLVLTPEEAASQDRLQQIAADEARRRGMRSAAWGQQGQP